MVRAGGRVTDSARALLDSKTASAPLTYCCKIYLRCNVFIIPVLTAAIETNRSKLSRASNAPLCSIHRQADVVSGDKVINQPGMPLVHRSRDPMICLLSVRKKGFKNSSFAFLLSNGNSAGYAC